ncbi:hypothetical protein [Kribbella endophytica]
MIGRLIAVTLAVAVALTACDSNAGGSATPPPFTPSAAPTTASTPTDPSAAAGVAAVEAYKRYRQVIDTMTGSGGTDVKDLPSVTTGLELEASKNQAVTYQGRKVHTVGQIKVLWARPGTISAPVDGKVVAVSVQACYDTTNIKAVDAAGKNVRPPGTPDRWLDNREVKFVGGSWKVANGRNQAAKC